ncbi:FMN-binding negative transcriptional regulator [Fimbriimonas ginsengisoli]|uniref:Transcriptional regulator n=1 Tax=Fimbriimonas ginsengisoli Gsoil 348 TaxID=661478 RepID=A0A068NSC8_FIMGI|nr:FMN-binding negative transcriptional regulator [Fimbriimonas ginsengisoli]AIE86448.1 transcriptional regulator [Fimbriimonas ginsengisoli Gsoil 348]
MYIPGPFRVDDPEIIRQVVAANPFAMLVSVQEGVPMATHLPVLLVQEEGQDVLVGHVAKANPHWQVFGSTALMVFAGPHGYVSPAWYETAPNVPTWNYVAVHAYGTPEIVEGDEALEHLRELVNVFDPHLEKTNPESTELEFLRKKMAGLVAFRMPVERWDAKAKLNQNKPESDRLAVRERYLGSSDPHERAMAEMMPGRS